MERKIWDKAKEYIRLYPYRDSCGNRLPMTEAEMIQKQFRFFCHAYYAQRHCAMLIKYMGPGLGDIGTPEYDEYWENQKDKKRWPFYGHLNMIDYLKSL